MEGILFFQKLPQMYPTSNISILFAIDWEESLNHFNQILNFKAHKLYQNQIIAYHSN